MKKAIIFFLILGFVFPTAQAAPIFSVQGGVDLGGYSVSIPTYVRSLVDEGDLVLMFCYEAKYQGGIAVASVEALKEALEESINKFQDLGISVDLGGSLDSALELRNEMEAICDAGSLEEAMARADNFKQESENIRDDLQIDLMANLRAEIEKQIASQEEVIRAKLEEELKEEATQLETERTAYYESLIRLEAEAEAAEIQSRLQAEIEQELMSQYGGQEDIDIDYVMRLGEQRGHERGEVEAKLVEERLRIKYEKLAEEEEVRLREIIEQKAKDKEEEIKKLYGDFSEISAKMESLRQAKLESEWNKYQALANEMKLVMLRKAIEKKFEEARELVEKERPYLEKAYEENVQNQYRIPRVEDLLLMLDRDEMEILTIFQKGDYSEEMIESVKSKFFEKWENLRKTLDEAKSLAPAEIIKSIQNKTNWSKLKNQLNGNLKHMRNVVQGYSNTEEHCRKNPTVVKDGKNINSCAKCRIVNSNYKEWFSASRDIDIKISHALILIDRLETHQKTIPSLDVALAYKDELQSALNNLATDEKKYEKIARDYEKAISVAAKECASYK